MGVGAGRRPHEVPAVARRVRQEVPRVGREGRRVAGVRSGAMGSGAISPLIPRMPRMLNKFEPIAVEPDSARSTILRMDAAMGHDGHTRMASAETSRNSFSVAPLAA